MASAGKLLYDLHHVQARKSKVDKVARQLDGRSKELQKLLKEAGVKPGDQHSYRGWTLEYVRAGERTTFPYEELVTYMLRFLRGKQREELVEQMGEGKVSKWHRVRVVAKPVEQPKAA
jgi:hypothetical protein